MELASAAFAVTGGASGLGLATARGRIGAASRVTLIDLPSSDGAAVADTLGSAAPFAAADVTDAEAFGPAREAADAEGDLRGRVHYAGAGRGCWTGTATPAPWRISSS